MPRSAPEPETAFHSLPVSRPTLVDYLLIFLGMCLSIVAGRYSGLHVEPHPDGPPFVTAHLLPWLPTFLLLPLGVLLLWPMFYGTQWLLGRKQPLTWGEWLWGISWVGHLLLIGWVVWATLGEPPAFLNPEQHRPPVVWVVLVVPALALIALVLAVVGLIGARRQPWTHAFGLALALWPALPLAGILLWGKPLWDKFSQAS
jgi:hypothetical protein